MKKKINKIVFPLVSLLVFLSLFFIMNSVLAATGKSYGLDSTVSSGNLAGAFNVRAVGNDAGQFLSSKLGSIVGSILSFVGVLLLVLVIYAGFLWMTAAGNEKSTEKAKSILVSAIIGLIIILSAYAITAFIGRQLVDTSALPAPDTTTDTTANLGNEWQCSADIDRCEPDSVNCSDGEVCNDACQCVAVNTTWQCSTNQYTCAPSATNNGCASGQFCNDSCQCVAAVPSDNTGAGTGNVLINGLCTSDDDCASETCSNGVCISAGN